VIIALLGSPFSPRYARARLSGGAPRALDFCAMNVAVYGRDAAAWSLTEHSIADEHRTADSLTIGRSRMAWCGGALVVDVDEHTAPWRRRLRGRIVLWPESPTTSAHVLDERRHHAWWPVAPLASVEVALEEPYLRFRGHGYHDANTGSSPLDAGFERWCWSRARWDERHTVVTYDTVERGGRSRTLALGFDDRGTVEPMGSLEEVPLPPTLWLLGRSARADARSSARVARSLEDGPFYARSLVEAKLGGKRVTTMHETLSGDRLQRAWVRWMLGYRMGRS
jgi:carotenoid 1,2-hydratase